MPAAKSTPILVLDNLPIAVAGDSPWGQATTVFTCLSQRTDIVKLQIPDLCNPDLSMLHWL